MTVTKYILIKLSIVKLIFIKIFKWIYFLRALHTVPFAYFFFFGESECKWMNGSNGSYDDNQVNDCSLLYTYGWWQALFNTFLLVDMLQWKYTNGKMSARQRHFHLRLMPYECEKPQILRSLALIESVSYLSPSPSIFLLFAQHFAYAWELKNQPSHYYLNANCFHFSLFFFLLPKKISHLWIMHEKTSKEWIIGNTNWICSGKKADSSKWTSNDNNDVILALKQFYEQRKKGKTAITN